MHDTTAEGNDYFKCDFCMRSWAEDRPMVEGHKGSLVCSKCLSAAYASVVLSEVGVQGIKGPLMETPAEGPACVMCLERRAELYWQSPLIEGAFLCRRCMRQGVVQLERDPDFGYVRPGAGEGGDAAIEPGEEEE